jgi:hypothetical protein
MKNIYSQLPNYKNLIQIALFATFLFSIVLLSTTQTAFANTAPIANVGPDVGVADTDGKGSQGITVDGKLSSDSDRTIEKYTWEITGYSTFSSTSSKLTTTLPTGEFPLVFTVTDDDNTNTDTVILKIKKSDGSPNTPPHC